MTGNLDLTLNRPQSLVHRVLRRDTSVCLPWGRGVGKSHMMRLFWYLLVAQWDGVLRTEALDPFRGVRIVHQQPTLKSCKDVHASYLEQDLAPSGKWGFLGAKIDHSTWKITFPGGSWIQWFGSREATARTSRGIRADAGTSDECDDTDKEVSDSIAGPWFSENWSFRMRLFGGTPRRGRHGLLYREHQAGLDGERARRIDLSTIRDEGERNRLIALRRKFTYHASYKTAPETVNRQYVEEQRALLVPAIFRREWECDFDSAEGLVYPHFSDDLHVRRPRPKAVPSLVLVGVDHGWEDPGVFLIIHVYGKGRDAVAHIVREVYEQHRLEGWWIERAKEIKKTYPNAYWYADPSRPDRIEAIRRGAGVNFVEANNAIEDGVSCVANRLALEVRPGDEEKDEPRMVSRLYVDPSCKKTIWELSNYRRKRDPRNEDRFLDMIEDKNNHACDAARYPLFTYFGAPSAPSRDHV